ncbi:hypothetical protein KA183_00470 [bacterium]|nr:hypothetical protein [bacterium]
MANANYSGKNSPKVIIIVLLALFAVFIIVAVYLVENTPVKYVPELIDKVSDKVGNRFYFENPSDKVLKERFLKCKESYESLVKMTKEDGVDRLDESLLSYVDDNEKPQFMPGTLGGKLKGKINQRRFFIYHELLCECKVRSIARLLEQRDKSQGVRFLVFTETGIQNSNNPGSQKYVVYLERDDYSTVENTDKAKPDKNGCVNALVKIEPHWYIWRYTFKPQDRKLF